jgi:hypothetical protein
MSRSSRPRNTQHLRNLSRTQWLSFSSQHVEGAAFNFTEAGLERCG